MVNWLANQQKSTLRPSETLCMRTSKYIERAVLSLRNRLEKSYKSHFKPKQGTKDPPEVFPQLSCEGWTHRRAEICDKIQIVAQWNLVQDVTLQALGGSTLAPVIKATVGPLAHHSPAAEGPLSDDDEWMPRMMQMMIDGVKEYTPRRYATIYQALNPSLNPAGLNVSGLAGNGGIHTPITVNINAPVYGVEDLKQAIHDCVAQYT